MTGCTVHDEDKRRVHLINERTVLINKMFRYSRHYLFAFFFVGGHRMGRPSQSKHFAFLGRTAGFRLVADGGLAVARRGITIPRVHLIPC